MNQDCLIAFGSNVGERETIFQHVLDRLRESDQIDQLVHSQLFETTPIGGPDNQNNYLNASIRFKTHFDALETWKQLSNLETELHRVRTGKWEPRTVDLDILLFGERNFAQQDLVIPHPRMSFRRFVLEPACEVAADMIHPLSGCTLSQLLQRIIKYPNRVILVGLERDEFACVKKEFEKIFIGKSHWELPTNESPSLLDEHEWQIHLADSLESFNRWSATTKLVVQVLFSDSQNPDPSASKEEAKKAVQAKAIRFPGPGLQIASNSYSDIAVHIAAAIRSMSTI